MLAKLQPVTHLIELLAAIARHLPLDSRQLLAQAITGSIFLLQGRLQLGQPGLRLAEHAFTHLIGLACQPAGQMLLHGCILPLFLADRRVFLAEGLDGLQVFLLLTGSLYRLMRCLKIMILPQHDLDFLLGIRHLKHVLAHKAGKAVDLLHRDRLLEKVHGLYLPDAENLAEFMAVLRIVVKGLDERVTLQLLAERAHIAADSREALGD